MLIANKEVLMKKSIIKNISLGIACLLGVGGAITAASIFNVDKPFEEAPQILFKEHLLTVLDAQKIINK